MTRSRFLLTNLVFTVIVLLLYLVVTICEEIPLGARIIAIADAYDAMTSDRPYRRAKSRAEAVSELNRCLVPSLTPTLS